MAKCGLAAHLHFRHLGLVLSEFRHEVRFYLFVEDGRFPAEPKMLPAPNPLTIYSRRPLGMMAAPIPEHRRPKGYTLDQNYGRPSDMLFYRS